MDTEVILSKIAKAKICIESASAQGADGTTLSAMSWLADALEDIVMTMQGSELKVQSSAKAGQRPLSTDPYRRTSKAVEAEI